jgi:hypothetical protein
MSCSVVADEWTWKDTSGKTSSLIYCGPDDTNLKQEEKTYYNGTYYDTEFFNIMNVPLAMNVIGGSRADINYSFSNYNICDENTYDSSKQWKNLQSSAPYKNIWNWSSAFDWEQLSKLGFLSREVYIPKTTTLTSPNYASAFTTTDGIEYTLKNGNASFGPPDNFEVKSGDIQFYVSMAKDITVRVSGGYSSGVLLTAQKVAYGESTGAMRVISLLELAKKCGSGTIETEGNPVHEMLEKIGAGYITYNSSQAAYESTKELELVDNMFNGGVSAFWKTSSTGGEGGAADNSDQDLIDVDNWEKQ